MVWNQNDWLDGSHQKNRLAWNQSVALDGNRRRCAVRNDRHPNGIQNDHPNDYQDASRSVRQDGHPSGYQDAHRHHQS
jgi:hypothetical protein